MRHLVDCWSQQQLGRRVEQSAIGRAGAAVWPTGKRSLMAWRWTAESGFAGGAAAHERRRSSRRRSSARIPSPKAAAVGDCQRHWHYE